MENKIHERRMKRMNKFNLSSVAKGVCKTIKKHSPEILTGIGIAGMITTAIMAVKATPKALILIEAEKERQNDVLLNEADENGWDNCAQITNLKPLDTVKTTWKCYIPAVVTGTMSVACLIGASSVNARRNAALATAYTLSESALKEYQEKVVETIGEKKEQSVRDAIAKDKIDRDPVTNREIIITEKGNTLCYDAVSGRYFKSDIQKLRTIENELNHLLFKETYVSLNEFYYEIGLRNTSLGDDLGWNAEDGDIRLNFHSQLADDGTPCLVIDYRVAPQYGFQKR